MTNDLSLGKAKFYENFEDFSTLNFYSDSNSNLYTTNIFYYTSFINHKRISLDRFLTHF